MLDVIITGIAIASLWSWVESLVRNRNVRLSWWLALRVPQGIAIAWALKILGAM